ncbi:hypothetical protein GOM71_19255 [Paenibacillus sp. NEAU-GSW1]|nr:hypothetical protein [Paenibacillus sp. NEAU-GSW1]
MHSWSSSDVVKKEEQNENFQTLDTEFGWRGINIRWKGANPNGTAGSYAALLSAVSDESDTIYIPKGVYLIEKNITISSAKRLVFARNARLKPASGVTITVNCTIDAGIFDWIFDVSAGGWIGGFPLVGDIYPHWFGAKGDGNTDDTAAFQAAMDVCNKKYRIFIPPGAYRIRRSIVNNSRGMYGAATYVDDQQDGAVLVWDPIDTATDLLPCILIDNAGIDAVFENFAIQGRVEYSSQYLSKWIDKSLFDQDLYAMFAAGTAAIAIESGARPIFRNIRTDRVKVGLLLNSTDGHITSYDCNWRGLIGVYCRMNSEDYYFQGGTIAGAFCGLMFGVMLYANHYGGFSGSMKRVHMGFSPYSFYQVKDASDYDANNQVNGMTGMMETVRAESTGEAVIKLLPNSWSTGLFFSGFAMSWSPAAYSSTEAWQYALPDDIKPPNEKQKYAIVLGRVNNSTFDDIEGAAFRSGAPGALGATYIEYIESDVVLTGLNPRDTKIKSKNIQTSLALTTPLAVGESLRTKVYHAMSHGNLLKNQEQLSNWSFISGKGTILTDLSALPVQPSDEMKRFIGNTIGGILKVTPDGVNTAYVQLPFLSSQSSAIDTTRSIGFEYYICSSASRFRSRIDFAGGQYLYDETFAVTPNQWTRIACREYKAPAASAGGASFFELSATQPTYIAAVMVCYDANGAYSPHYHPYAKQPIESADSFILTDKSTGARCKIELVNGALQITAL